MVLILVLLNRVLHNGKRLENNGRISILSINLSVLSTTNDEDKRMTRINELKLIGLVCEKLFPLFVFDFYRASEK
jgi:hypothetical protein